MVEVVQKNFNEHQMTQVPITEKYLGTMEMIEEVFDHVGMNYPKTPDSRYATQTIDDFLFPCEEGSVDNPITIEEDEGFSASRTPVSNQQVLLDSSLICKIV